VDDLGELGMRTRARVDPLERTFILNFQTRPFGSEGQVLRVAPGKVEGLAPALISPGLPELPLLCVEVLLPLDMAST